MTEGSQPPFPLTLPEQRRTLSVTEAAELLGVSRWLVLQQVAHGDLPHKRFGRRILIPRGRFLAWLEEQPGGDQQAS